MPTAMVAFVQATYRVFFNDWVKVWALYSGQNTSWELGEVYFFQLGHNILKLCFEKIQGISCIFQIWMEFEAQIVKICKINRQSRIKQTSVLFCKYLTNESSDPHEILCGCHLPSCELYFQISWRSVHKCARLSCKGVRARFIANACIYNLCAHIYARIFMKFETWSHKVVIDHQIKFHKDPSFCCGDIDKTILTFRKH